MPDNQPPVTIDTGSGTTIDLPAPRLIIPPSLQWMSVEAPSRPRFCEEVLIWCQDEGKPGGWHQAMCASDSGDPKLLFSFMDDDDGKYARNVTHWARVPGPRVMQRPGGQNA